nr:tail fiber domain-containing protein [Thermoanaerobaculia bacterium]MBP9826711.1 tail fiber domain-containing protein [Thermoanaerobaculia bacterium]
SSRELKTGIVDLSPEVAREALDGLQPVTFAYRSNPEDQQVGFIAEDVPDLVATEDHRGLSAMDVVAVLTGVVKQQQRTIETLEARLRAIEASGAERP